MTEGWELETAKSLERERERERQGAQGGRETEGGSGEAANTHTRPDLG